MSFSRRPRAVVRVNGDDLDGWTSIDLEANEYAAPDTFRVAFSMSKLQLDRGPKYWAAVQSADVEIFEGFPTDPDNFTASDLERAFVGKVDNVSMDWVGRTITIDGRDLTAKLIDTKNSENFRNLTASAIAAKLAGKYGLKTEITATKQKAGRFYKIDHVDLQDERTEWDILTYLAAQEGFAVFVNVDVLYFGPRATADSQPKFIITRREATADRTEDTNYEYLNTYRTLTVAGDIRVTDRSWNSKQKRAFTKTARRPQGAASTGGPKQEYSYTIPGLSADETQKRADQILADLSRHAMRLSYSGAGRTSLTMSEVILLQGTGTAFDQVYFPERITRTLTPDEGFTWNIEAKNSAAEDKAL